MKKIFFLLILIFFPLITLNAVPSDEVDYSVEGIYINGQIEIAGAVHFREIIKISGTYNGYIRDLIYKRDAPSFNGDADSFYNSDIYNGDGVIINKVGILNVEDFSFENFDENHINENVDFFKNESNNTYEISSINNGKSIKMYNETIRGETYFYIDYTVTNLIVEHNDCAEFYYNIIGDSFDDYINEVKAVVYLPEADPDNLRIWAHGPLNGEAYIIEGGYGGILKINGLNSFTSIDLRMTYSKELFPININEHKKSGVDAIPFILEAENKRAEEANIQRRAAKITVYTSVISGILYIMGIVALTFYAYIKHDKEYKSEFKNRYNREFIEDYDVEVVDYLMKKNISSDAFSASILNLIYKKKISVEEIKEKKKDYLFTLISKEGISESETKIIELLFDKIGSDNKVKMSKIKKVSKEVYSTNKNVIYDSFNAWKNIVFKESQKQEFFTKNLKVKLLLGFYGILGFLIFALLVNVGLESFGIILLVISIIYLLYIILFTKRTVKGNEHYIKWKAFKRFLEDFGRFKEKELPEIVLWERYLVYATVLGVADKVSKAMKVKFEEMNINNNTFDNTFYHIYLFNSINNDISRNINSSIQSSISTVNIANSKTSSGSGFGGGFSSGGGFGGGGGGGRGF